MAPLKPKKSNDPPDDPDGEDARVKYHEFLQNNAIEDPESRELYELLNSMVDREDGDEAPKEQYTPDKRFIFYDFESVQTRELKPRLHIFCEGEKTEPNYLKGYVESRFPGTTLSPVKRTDKNTPVQLVEVAIAAKKNNPDDDQFWVVYDREATNKYPDALHAEARNKANAAALTRSCQRVSGFTNPNCSKASMSVSLIICPRKIIVCP